MQTFPTGIVAAPARLAHSNPPAALAQRALAAAQSTSLLQAQTQQRVILTGGNPALLSGGEAARDRPLNRLMYPNCAQSPWFITTIGSA